MMFNKIFNKSYIFLCVFLIACGSVANQTFQEKNKLFELDLTDEQISAEGGGIELYKRESSCFLLLKIYGETGQESYGFQFEKNNLIDTIHIVYRYKNGLLVIDDDLKDLIADNNAESSDTNDLELISEKKIIGNTDKSIANKFEVYKQKIPKTILAKSCN